MFDIFNVIFNNKLYYNSNTVSYYKPPEIDYDKYSFKKLLAIPLTLIIISIGILIIWTLMTGVPIDRGMDFVGGTEVRIDVGDIDNPEQTIEELDLGEDSITAVPGTGEYIVTFADGVVTADEIESAVDSHDSLSITELSQVSPAIGGDSQQTALMGMIIAFGLMSAFVIALFREIIPAFIIILSVVGNLSITMASMNVIGIELTFGTVGALLMLIGYSVDSDILLNTYILKGRKQTFLEQTHDAMRTGVTMNVTSLSAMLVLTLGSFIMSIELLYHMGLILSIGLISDLIITYSMNVGILRYYKTKGDSQ